MSAVSESVGRRMTLGYLVDHYGFDLEPSFAMDVTITSLADDVDSVGPGSLYIPSHSVDAEHLERVRARGAYAALVPHAMREMASDAQFPLLFAEPDARQIGKLASDIAGKPSGMLAMFAICGEDGDEVEANVVRLADFLHMLGNPVGVISASGSSSLERRLDLRHPVGILDVQHTLAVCGEDGAAAAVIALNERTLRPDALQSVGIDVLGSVDDVRQQSISSLRAAQGYGFIADKQLTMTMRTEESDVLASQSALGQGDESERRLSLAIAMTLAAGVRRGNIKSALRVSRELR
ncbi:MULTISPECIES: UDP-N-acetylmuramyl peptide synthase [Bifidobacterium]|jgi:hypothetical protein|uniref:UDP-N-acetylmuramyl peptide synthase n=1 Tax=Bifidobacterium tibiigranuli TaxID=2172043 RepID=A0A5N6S646_9BIFI|nr:UDP-N-acetylmuramyl peptide synthase [Bifidobacterium tibiigranuli]KAE8128331.1 UDP-N-acetylmuramyl peptide synthase [Bifidobacterium tibiigranuli]KAE8128654.1 UDP-N-acetylmuramyl peptide synthase [Bifidobacterium tibiigranuli]MCH3974844.1 UDP-N-acetylmuramyl peptide synthase [Bifidobacterium tibiigranuli]MCH4190255.1 UDP-N-acetylmuramyl peptide synthase [Bifidobacterium tibiigranuli]MCH4202603.1 UDP-N-acetylmuramyl peptide synthase [Bifidobacterium tibiigranuli]